MTRRTLLVPLFVAALILAPSEISGQIEAVSAVSLGAPPSWRPSAGWKPALPASGSPATSRRTG